MCCTKSQQSVVRHTRSPILGPKMKSFSLFVFLVTSSSAVAAEDSNPDDQVAMESQIMKGALSYIEPPPAMLAASDEAEKAAEQKYLAELEEYYRELQEYHEQYGSGVSSDAASVQEDSLPPDLTKRVDLFDSLTDSPAKKWILGFTALGLFTQGFIRPYATQSVSGTTAYRKRSR